MPHITIPALGWGDTLTPVIHDQYDDPWAVLEFADAEVFQDTDCTECRRCINHNDTTRPTFAAEAEKLARYLYFVAPGTFVTELRHALDAQRLVGTGLRLDGVHATVHERPPAPIVDLDDVFDDDEDDEDEYQDD